MTADRPAQATSGQPETGRGPVVAGEPAADRLMRNLEHRLTRAQVAVVLHAEIAHRLGNMHSAWATADAVLHLPAVRRLLDAQAAVQRVESLHYPEPTSPPCCAEDGLDWPCPTTRALDGAR